MIDFLKRMVKPKKPYFSNYKVNGEILSTGEVLAYNS